ncbi:AIPR family protein [Gandjariella thermophila]|uniref:Putative abortive infection phage resistance protein n=1 Tax=Gandjariella thermophila TaxID=1931992 RepID=A0A4D4JEF2_9PSEU|nr:AIPR family protein [Gandjariella thermophila]GDY33038.1 putative abortive infection phage resistance protein [Gandjariella thermophila]
MIPPQVRHVKDALVREFTDHINLDDIANRPQQEQEQAFLSRALAALALRDLTGLDAAHAAAGVIDGQDDHGIDAVAVSEGGSHLWLVQAKWSDKGKAALDQGSALKLRDGLDHILSGRYSKFNARFQALAERVDGVIDNAQCRITLVLALCGKSTLDRHAQEVLDKACDDLNIDVPMLDYAVVGLSEFHRMVRLGIAERKANLNVLLENFSHIQEPYRAYYGTIPVAQVAEWYSQHGTRLFSQNIRDSLGLTEVNRSLVQTLVTEPEHFWYFNNGITVLCDSVQRSARNATTIGGPVELQLSGASVVNGAQTVASIHSGMRQAPDTAGAARVWVRLISLENCPNGFATDVTRATNTQNRVEGQDFAALDETQARLRDDFVLSLGKSYVVKRGEEKPAADAGCSISEAAVALACAHRNPEMSVRVKQDRLWEGDTLASVFGHNPNAYRVWRCVLISREVRKSLATLQKDHEGRAVAIATHGDLMVAHAVFRQLGPEQFDDPACDWDSVVTRVPQLTATALDWLIHHVDAQFGPTSYPVAVFKNAAKCRQLADAVLKDVAAGHSVPELPPEYRPVAPETTTRATPAVKVLVEAKRIADGTTLEFRPVTGPERKALAHWLAEDPRRGRANWVNNSNRPLLWTADGRRYSPSRLVAVMLEQARGYPPTAVQGTSRWFVPGEGSLVEIADRVRREEAS